MDVSFERQQQYFDNQSRLNAELRTRQEVQQQSLEIQAQNLEIQAQNFEIQRQSLEIQRQSLEIQEQNVNRLISIVRTVVEEFRQHRSDGHGA